MPEINAPETQSKELNDRAAEALPEKSKDTAEALLKMSRYAREAETKAADLREGKYPEVKKHEAVSLAMTYEALAKELRADVAAEIRDKMPAMKAAAAADCAQAGGGENRDAKRYLGALADFATLERLEKDPTSTDASPLESSLSSLASQANSKDDDLVLRKLKDDVKDLADRAKYTSEKVAAGAQSAEAGRAREPKRYLDALADFARLERLAADPRSSEKTAAEISLEKFAGRAGGTDGDKAVLDALGDRGVLDVSRRAAESARFAPAKAPAKK